MSYDAYDDVMDRLNRTNPVRPPRDPYIPEGEHESLIVLALEAFTSERDRHRCVRVTFEVEKSDTLAAGSRAAEFWDLDESAPKDAGPNAITGWDRMVDFVHKLTAPTSAQELANYIVALTKTSEEDKNGQMEKQPARGIRVRCRAFKIVSKKTGKPFTAKEWFNVPQDAAQIAATRAELDAKSPQRQAAPAPAAPPKPAVTKPAGGFLSQFAKK